MFSTLFNQYATIYTPSNSKSSLGGSIQHWRIKATYVKCRVSPINGNVRFTSGRFVTESTHTVYLGEAYSITTADRLLIGDTLYKIVNYPQGQWHRQIDVEALPVGTTLPLIDIDSLTVSEFENLSLTNLEILGVA